MSRSSDLRKPAIEHEGRTLSKRGRPTLYAPELAASICERLAAGETLIAICEGADMPSDTTVRGWALEDRGGFFSQYARAREIGYQRMADELVSIADAAGGDVQRDRLRDRHAEVAALQGAAEGLRRQAAARWRRGRADQARARRGGGPRRHHQRHGRKEEGRMTSLAEALAAMPEKLRAGAIHLMEITAEVHRAAAPLRTCRSRSRQQ